MSIVDRLSTMKPSAVMCPECGGIYSNVIDTRYVKKTELLVPGTRRRRVCLHCDRRFTTYEFRRTDIRKFVREKHYITNSRLRDFVKDITKLKNEIL